MRCKSGTKPNGRYLTRWNHNHVKCRKACIENQGSYTRTSQVCLMAVWLFSPNLKRNYVACCGAGIAQSVQGLGHGLDVRGIVVRYPEGVRELSCLQNVNTGSASYSMRTESKRPGRKANFSCSFSAEVKNELIYTCIPPYSLMTFSNIISIYI
jgi:hypothetical protein